MQIYLVGGAVRDKLLNLPIKDRDWLVVGATPDMLLKEGFDQVGAKFPVFLHPKTKEEYALARTERKQGHGYTGFICDFAPSVTLEEDLSRRDLTINAMAMDDDGNLIDPYNGRRDLESRKLRHVSEAFTEDPLRVLRVARFAARYADIGFTVAEETLALMRTIAASGELTALTPERVWQETERALMESRSSVYFQTLREVGALAELFPEIDALFGLSVQTEYHPEVDAGVHSLAALDMAGRLNGDLSVRFAALTYDLGKVLTSQDNRFGREAVGCKLIDELCDRVKIPKNCRELARLASSYHPFVHRFTDLEPKEMLQVLNACDAWRRPERLDDFARVCEAVARGRSGLENKAYPQTDCLISAYQAAQAVAVQDIIAAGYKGGKIGEELNLRRVKALAAMKEELSSFGSPV